MLGFILFVFVVFIVFWWRSLIVIRDNYVFRGSLDGGGEGMISVYGSIRVGRWGW